MLLGGGEDALGQRAACPGASVTTPVVGAVGKSSSGEIPPLPPQKVEEAVVAAGGWPPAHDAPISPDLRSTMAEVSVVLPSPPP
jgi:hypothetical protein